MTCHYPDLGSASDWQCGERNLTLNQPMERQLIKTNKLSNNFNYMSCLVPPTEIISN